MSKSGNGWSAWVHGVSDTGPSEPGGTHTEGSSVEPRIQTPGPHVSSLPPAYGTLPPRPLGGPDVTVLLGPQKVSLVEAYLLWFVLGVTGAHHFYLRRPCFGFVYLLTGGLVGIGWLVDGFRLPWLVEETNQRLRNPQLVKTVTLSDAYVLWFPFGFLGFHLFYLRRPWEGIFYFLTGGGFGIGWLVDAVRIPYLVKQCNEMPPDAELTKNMLCSFLLWLPPFGLFGCHHFYLRRYGWGILYFLTGGLCGIGWLVDLFRLFVLTNRYRRQNALELDPRRKHTDDAYILWFPLGIIGFHHFYLGRYGWGIIYLLTGGLCLIGWIADLFRIPSLVKDYNNNLEVQSLLSILARDSLPRDYGNGVSSVGYPDAVAAPCGSDLDPGFSSYQGISRRCVQLHLPSYDEAMENSKGH